MYDNFNVEDSLEKIKSSLFDIYESQERIIGSLSSESEKTKQVQKYIETKDLAVKLLENISQLYQKEEIPLEEVKEVDEEQKPQEEISEAEEKQEPQDEVSDEVASKEEPIIVEEETISNGSVEDSTDFNDEVSKDDNGTNINDVEISSGEEVKEEQPIESQEQKFYLDDRNGNRPNFAYVPEAIYIKIKENGNLDHTNRIYKQDQEKVRGIIVRNDQFMKLSFSKHRQEGVLNEAKAFRIQQAKKSRQKLQAEALENGKVEINI